MKKRIVYVAHPIAGDVANNLSDLARILRIINLEYPDIIPVAPYYADCIALDDNDGLHRKRGIENCNALIATGVFNELWLIGNKVSFGMQEEIKLFKSLGTPIINYVGKF